MHIPWFHVFALAMALAANAQVSVHLESLPWYAGTTTVTEGTNGQQDIDPGPTGGNQSWDFTALPGVWSFEETMLDPAGQPGSEEFPAATICESLADDMGTRYTYSRLDEAGIWMLGGMYHIPPDDGEAYHVVSNGPDFINTIDYGSTWSRTRTVSYDDGYYTDTDSSMYEVDAWGSITDASGTFECLRVLVHGFNVIVEDGETIDQYEYWEYQWWAPEWGLVCKSIVYGSEPQFSNCFFTRVSELTVGVDERPLALPKELQLEAVWPNPFNPQAHVAFHLNRTAELRLAVFDVMGRKIRQLASGRHVAGRHEVVFDGTGLASGTYLLRLESSQLGSDTKSVVLLK